jgi:hypothetical protein
VLGKVLRADELVAAPCRLCLPPQMNESNKARRSPIPPRHPWHAVNPRAPHLPPPCEGGVLLPQQQQVQRLAQRVLRRSHAQRQVQQHTAWDGSVPLGWVGWKGARRAVFNTPWAATWQSHRGHRAAAAVQPIRIGHWCCCYSPYRASVAARPSTIRLTMMLLIGGWVGGRVHGWVGG